MTRGRKKKVAAKSNGSKDPAVSVVCGVELKGPIMVDGMKHFSKQDMQVLELAQFKFVNAEQAARLMGHDATEYQRKANEKLAQMQLKKKQLDDLTAERKSELIKVRSAIQSVYGIEDLDKVTYDDETGRITEPPDDAAGSQPVA